MKGIELPINVLIIVAVALVVLLAIIAIYFSGFNPFSGAMNIEAAKNEACRRLVQENRCGGTPAGIIITDLDFSYNGDVQDTLDELCQDVFNTANDAKCKQMCGCP